MSGKVLKFHALRLALWALVNAAIPEGADEFVLIGIDRDDGLARRLCGDFPGVYVLELGVALRQQPRTAASKAHSPFESAGMSSYFS